MNVLQDTLTQGIKDFTKKAIKAQEIAIATAGAKAIGDALNKEPTPPIYSSFLRESWFVYANAKLVNKGKDAEVPSTIDRRKGYVHADFGFSAEYAFDVHEDLPPSPTATKNLGPRSQAAGDAGGKFLESKIAQYKNDYKATYARKFEEELKK